MIDLEYLFKCGPVAFILIIALYIYAVYVSFKNKKEK